MDFIIEKVKKGYEIGRRSKQGYLCVVKEAVYLVINEGVNACVFKEGPIKLAIIASNVGKIFSGEHSVEEEVITAIISSEEEVKTFLDGGNIS